MKINTNTRYLFRMANMEDEYKQRTHYLFRVRNMEDEGKHR